MLDERIVVKFIRLFLSMIKRLQTDEGQIILNTGNDYIITELDVYL